MEGALLPALLNTASMAQALCAPRDYESNEPVLQQGSVQPERLELPDKNRAELEQVADASA